MIKLVAGMAYSDVIVLSVLKEMIEASGADTVISQSTIAETCGIPIRTTQEALRRLMRRGELIGSFTPGVGYRYTVNVRN